MRNFFLYNAIAKTEIISSPKGGGASIKHTLFSFFLFIYLFSLKERQLYETEDQRL